MWIKLKKNGPAMWFLGDPPKNIKVNLNFVNPGPVDLDFKSLQLGEQKQVLIALKEEKIETDEDYQNLYNIYTKLLSQKEEIVEENDKPIKKKFSLFKKDSVAQLQKDREKREIQLKERCNYLSKQSIKAIKSALKKEKDVKFLKMFLEMEESKKGRVSIIDFIKTQIRKFQKEVAVSLKKNKDTEPIKLDTPGATYSKDVVESNEGTISLSREELVSLAIGKEL